MIQQIQPSFASEETKASKRNKPSRALLHVHTVARLEKLKETKLVSEPSGLDLFLFLNSL